MRLPNRRLFALVVAAAVGLTACSGSTDTDLAEAAPDVVVPIPGPIALKPLVRCGSRFPGRHGRRRQLTNPGTGADWISDVALVAPFVAYDVGRD